MSIRVVNTAAFVLAVIAMALFNACGAFGADESPAHGDSHAGAEADHDHDAHADHGDHDDAGAHGDAHEGGHGGDVNLNPLDWKSDLAIWTGVVFVLLLLVLGKFAWGPIADGLDKREARGLPAEIQAAETGQRRCQGSAGRAIRRSLTAAGDEVRQLIDQAKRDAEAVGPPDI